MGIQNYLKRVSKATKDIKSAIEEKGVSVAQCDGFETLANKVRAIQTESSSDGSSLFTVLAFTSSQTKPSTPTGGSFTASAISYPSGWSDGGGLSKYIWMSYIVFKGDGSVYKNWVSPILINGAIDDSGEPFDLTDLATKTWVIEQIKNSIKPGGIIDLSNYATKDYVDSKITESTSGVASINGLTGAVNLVKGTDNVTIEEEGKNIKISVNTSGTEGDTFKEFILYTTSASDSIAPEVPSADTTWDEDTDELINLPTGWRKTVIVTTSAKYVWRITGIFSKKSRKISGSWYGPYCITGPEGENGQQTEEIYAVYGTLVEDSNMSVDNTSANADNAHSTDKYLPNFIFNGKTVKASGEILSVSSETPYQYISKRTKSQGSKEWSDFSSPKLYNNFTKAALDETTLQELKDTATNAAQESIENAVSDLNTARNDINNMRQALGYENGIYKKLNEYDETNQTLTSQLGEVKDTADKSSATVSAFQQTIDSITQRVENTEATTESLNEKVTSLTSDVDGIRGQVSTFETWKKEGYKQDLKTAGFLTSDEAQEGFATKTDFNTVTSGLNKVTANVNQMSNIYGRYLMNKAGNYVDEKGYIIYTDSSASTAVYYKENSYYTKTANSETGETEYNPYSGNTSDLHLIGANLFSDEDNAREQATTEISKYGVIIADNMSAVRSYVDDKTAEASLVASVTNSDGFTKKVSAISVEAVKDDLSNISLTADKILFSNGTSLDTIVSIDTASGEVSASSLKTKDSGEGTVEIKNDTLKLISDDKNVFTVSSTIDGDVDSSVEKKFTKQIKSTASLTSGSTDSTTGSIVKDNQLIYNWSDSFELGTITGVANKSVVIPQTALTFCYIPSFGAINASGSTGAAGTVQITVSSKVGNQTVSSSSHRFSVYYNTSEGWRINNGDQANVGILFIHPYAVYDCTEDSYTISYEISTNVNISFTGDYTSGDNGVNYDTGSFISGDSEHVIQVIPMRSGSYIGSNGFNFNLNSATRILCIKNTQGDANMILENPYYGLNVSPSGLSLKYNGKWYTASVANDSGKTILKFIQES